MNNKFIILIFLILLFPSFLYANTKKDFNQINDKTNQIQYAQNLQKIENDAEILALLLISEMALQKGNIQFALYGYTSLLEKTNNTNIAKRDEEIALYVGAYDLANEIHKKWQQIEPIPSFNQKLIEWQKNIIYRKNIDKIIQDLPYIIENASENEKRKCFIYISELALKDNALKNNNLSDIGYKIIHNYSKKYNNYSEYDIADLIFSANSNHIHQAKNALKRLTKKDPTLTPNLAFYLGNMSNYLPEIFDSYFEKISSNEADKLNDFWTTLYIDSLLRTKKIDKAYNIVIKNLDKEPSFERYFQAGYISSFIDKDPEKIQNYFEKSYALANKTQQDRVALFAAISLINLEKNKDFNLSYNWINKINENKLPFDKNFLIALWAFNNKNWDLANLKLQQLSKSKIKRGIYYSQSDVFKLSIFTLTESLSPKQALEKINSSINSYKNIIDNNTTSSKNKEMLKNSLSDLIYQKAFILANKFERYEDSIVSFKDYLKLNPNDSNAINSLGYTMLKIPNQIDQGLELIKKSYKLNPKSPPTNDSLGWAYYLKGKYKKALPYLEYAHKNLPNSETATHLAAVYYELGYKDKAFNLFKEAYDFEKQCKELLELMQKYNISIKQ